MASTSQAFKRDESELLEDDVVSLTSSDPGASALLGSTQEEQEMSEGEEAEAEPSQTSCPAYEELLEVMDRATYIFDTPTPRSPSHSTIQSPTRSQFTRDASPEY
ncbi:hypothetical protein QQF64_034156 [Cirrhinus molitorella]|uniref:Uncharacterized protein n=1 Tax=Cirrhinus molitorella TaxID=172907 RepID=A0ABR3MVX6_9TELE